MTPTLANYKLNKYKNGTPVIYHSAQYHVISNDPDYDVQLKNMQQYEGLGGDQPIPGTDSPADRLVRAAYYEKQLPEADTTADEVQGVMSILENSGQPNKYFFATPYIETTIWRTVADLTHHVYYFYSTKDFTMNFTRLDQFYLSPGGPVLKLDLVSNTGLMGNVTNKYKAL